MALNRSFVKNAAVQKAYEIYNKMGSSVNCGNRLAKIVDNSCFWLTNMGFCTLSLTAQKVIGKQKTRRLTHF